MSLIRAPKSETARLRSVPAACILDGDSRVTWRSQGDHPLFEPEEIGAGKGFDKLWHNDDRERVARAVAASIQRGHSIFSARSARTGEWIDAVVHSRRGDAGRPLELLVSINASAEEGAAVDDYMTLFNAAPVALWTTHDPDASFILGNPASERRYIFATGENQSKSPPPGSPPPDNYRIFQNGSEVPADRLPMQRAVKGEDVLNEEYEIRLRDGRRNYAILNASPMRNARGDIIGCVCVDVDITERKRIETAQQRLLECSRVTGQAFFAALVKAIAGSLDARQVYIAEIDPKRPSILKTLAGVFDGEPKDFGTFEPVGTPCRHVVDSGKSIFISSNLLSLYPAADDLRATNMDSYVGAPLFGSDGSIIGVIGVCHDGPLATYMDPVELLELFGGRAAAEIQRLRIEQSLRQSEEEYRIITDAVPALITFVDTDGRYRFVNAAMKTWLDVDPQVAKGKHISEVVGASAYATIKDNITRALRGERQKFEALIPYDGRAAKHISAEYVPHVVDGEVRGFFAFITDITEQMAGAEALSKSERQFRTLFEHLPVGAALADSDGRAVLENDVFSRLLPAKGPDSSIFDRLSTAYGPNGTLLPLDAHPLRHALDGKVVREVELQCRRDDGTAAWVRMSAIPIFADKGQVTGALVVVADIEGEKQDEARRTLLINELNHRVKNTLASVQSIAAQTFRTSILTEDGLAAFEERLLALSNAHNLLTQEHWEGADLKRLSTLVLEPHDPGDGRVRTTGSSVRLKPPAALAFAMALHELATNAVKYGALSTPRGRVDLKWTVDKTPDGRRLRVSWIEKGGPPIRLPIKKGFGTRLIERSLAFELGSESTIRYEPDGVVCDIDADMSEISN